jgi:antitoxin (DNA-binding transcriptional repressor) of toxin-antitoxin stability system
MHHMKKASVRDLRYRFTEIERALSQGHSVEITKRKRLIARIVPAGQSAPTEFPDFHARAKKILGTKKLKISGAELIRRERDEGF